MSHSPALEQAKLHSAFKDLNDGLASTAKASGQQLNIAHGLCLTGGDVSGDFKALLRDRYEAELFAGDLEVINGWVKKKTEGKIEKILERLSPDTVCVLLNAICFKGTWECRFDATSTREAPFKVPEGESVKVPMMYQESEFRVLKEAGFQAICLPYRGKQLSMVIFLPGEEDGLPALEEKLTTDALARWLTALDKGPEDKTALFLPKYKLETDCDLVPTCRQLGMKDAFKPGVADFSGMGRPKGGLVIEQIQHKALVEVNEEGTEAVAATAADVALGAPNFFRADHPFLFIIRDNPIGTILFMGRLSQP